MNFHTISKPLRKTKYREDTLDENRLIHQKSEQSMISKGHLNFIKETPEALPVFISRVAIKNDEVPESPEIVPKLNTSLVVLSPMDLGECPFKTTALKDNIQVFPKDHLTTSFIELFQAMPLNLSYPFRIQIQIMPPTTVPFSCEDNVSLKINMQIANTLEVDNALMIREPHWFTNHLDILKNEEQKPDFELITDNNAAEMRLDSEPSGWYESLSFEMKIAPAVYENLAYLASKEAVSKFMVCNLNYFLFYGYTPMTTDLKYLDTALKGATFSAINTFTSPFFINFLAEPIYDFGKSLISQNETPRNPLSLEGIFDNIHDLWNESLSQIKPMSEGQLGTSGLYSASSKFIRDSICNAVGSNMLCRVLNSLPASNVVKNTLKANFGDNLFPEIDQFSLLSHGGLFPEMTIPESNGVF